MDPQNLKPGLRVRTNAVLGNTEGMLIAPAILANRRPDATGTLRGYVPGHGGDCWFVEHEGGAVAAYVCNEFDQDDTPEVPAEVRDVVRCQREADAAREALRMAKRAVECADAELARAKDRLVDVLEAEEAVDCEGFRVSRLEEGAIEVRRLS